MKKLLLSCCVLVALGVKANDVYEPIIKLQQNGQHQQALEQLSQLLAQNQDDAQALLLQGNTLQQMGQLEQATAIYKKLINQNPQMPEAYNNLAVLYADNGKMALAIETLQQAFATSDSYATAYKNLRSLYNEMASSAYREALDIDKPKKKSSTHFALLNRADSLPTISDEMIVAKTSNQTEPKVTAALNAAKDDSAEVDQTEAVTQLITAWSQAWAARNITDYFAAYHPAFVPPQGMKRKAWESYRAKRLRRPKFIEIQIVGVVIDVVNSNKATAIFEQHYRSDTYSDTVVKKLTLRKFNNRWLIAQEVTL